MSHAVPQKTCGMKARGRGVEWKIMNDVCTYLVVLRGRIDEAEINSLSPQQVAVTSADAAATSLTVCTDQAGLIGLLRHLHGLGFIFEAVTRVDRG